MKRFLLYCFIMLAGISLTAQTLVTFTFGGQSRKYLEYIPSNYNNQNSVPVVFCLHGLGDNIDNFKGIGMHVIGDTAGFITIYPEAMSSMFGTAWNSGASYMGFVLNSTVNDVGFLMAIMDSLQANYNIDMQRIYFCGFSMGGFMSQRMACEMSNKVAAIASVAGTIGTSLTCNPSIAVPICHFHGRADSQVSYSSNQYGMNAEQLVQFWVQNNACDTNYIFQTYPDIVNDSISVESYYYNSQNHTADVMFYKALGADHQWLYPPVNDISYTIEIWNFLRKFQLTSQQVEENKKDEILIYPNPAKNKIYISTTAKIQLPFNIDIIDLFGKKIKSIKSDTNYKAVDVNSLKTGTYIFRLSTKNNVIEKKIIIQ